MKKKFRFITASALLVTGVVLFSCGGDETTDGTDGTDNTPGTADVDYLTSSSDTCYCEDFWFPHDSTPDPEEGAGSPFDTDNTTNCMFHQWSWQKFLWLTRPTSDSTVLFESQLTLINPDMSHVAPINGVNLVLDAYQQAGGGGILSSNSQYNPESGGSNIVYYSIHINDVLEDAAIEFKDWIGTDTTRVKENTKTFPVKSLELKVSWVDVNSIPEADRSSYYQQTAYIVDAQGAQTKTTVALTGMHVTGVVINHPEFIWATFEHDDMAPMYDWAAATAGGADVPVTSADQKLFFAQGSTAGLTDIEWTNGDTDPRDPNNIFSLYKYGVPVVPGGGFMTTTQQDGAENYHNIDTLNNCVKSSLAGTDVWRNYFYNGSIWMNTDGMSLDSIANMLNSLGYSLADAGPGTVARGSVNCYNITMETYEQTHAKKSINAITVDSLENCFNCHEAAGGITIGGVKYSSTSPLYISHIFREFLMSSTGTDAATLMQLRREEFQNMLNTKAGN